MIHYLAFLTLVAFANAEVALVIGGYGASDSVQVITKDGVCLGSHANPSIPNAPDGTDPLSSLQSAPPNGHSHHF